MADYNAWMNKNIYATARQLTPAEISADRGAFFGSILATLNHLVVADTIWLKRFANHPTGFSSSADINLLPDPASLDEILHRSIEELWPARQAMDQLINRFVAEISDSDLAVPLEYINTQGKSYKKNFFSLLSHLFNHQTHHRGQVCTLLTQSGLNVGVTDLLVRIPDVPH